MARELDAKVARVLSDTSIAINVGESSGVGRGNTVIVWRSVEVKDPDTGDVLGSVRLQNLRLDVYEVQPRFSLARVETRGFGSSLGGIFAPSKVIASSNRVLDQEQVQLGIGDAVTVMIDDSLLAASVEDDELPSEDGSE